MQSKPTMPDFRHGQYSRKRIGYLLLILGLNVVLSLALAWLNNVGYFDYRPSGKEAFQFGLVFLVFLVSGTYALLIIHFCHLAQTLRQYFFRGYITVSCIHFATSEMAEALYAELLSFVPICMLLIFPWIVAGLLLRSDRLRREYEMSKHFGDYD